jgi:hypothetical protein
MMDCAFRLARVKPNDVKFGIVDGSRDAGSEQKKHSDWDVVVLRKKKLKRTDSVEDLFWIQGTALQGWLADEDPSKHH